MNDELLQRVAALEARMEISQLIAQYGPAVDDRDYETLGSLYTADGVFDTVGGRLSGRAAVVDYYRQRGSAYGATYHYPHSIEIHLDEPSSDHRAAARGVVCAHAELAIDGVTHLVGLRYHDAYKHEDSAWRFYERVVKLLYVLPASDLTSGLAASDRIRWPGTTWERAALGPDID